MKNKQFIIDASVNRKGCEVCPDIAPFAKKLGMLCVQSSLYYAVYFVSLIFLQILKTLKL
jgi:hypothetical protein